MMKPFQQLVSSASACLQDGCYSAAFLHPKDPDHEEDEEEEEEDDEDDEDEEDHEDDEDDEEDGNNFPLLLHKRKWETIPPTV